MDLEGVDDADIAAVAAAVRQFLVGRVRDQSIVDDLTQETVARVLEVGHRLDRSAWVPYAVTVAKRLIVAQGRSADIAQRHIHRLSPDPSEPPPDDLVLRRDDEEALRAALRALPDDDRALLLAHVVDGTDTGTLAERTGGTAGGVAAKLARTRARARVDYVVASNRATLPTTRCRPVLLSLSAADRRRQKANRAADHLLECAVCADLGPQLLARRRSLGLLIPIPIVARLLGAGRAFFNSHVLASVGGAVGVAAVTTVAVIAATGPVHRPVPAQTSPRPRPTVGSAPTVADLDVRTLLTIAPRRWPPLAGRRVVARSIPILSVPADEGFWIGFSATRRIWVQLAVRGESSIHVVAGHRASFRGALVVHGPNFAAQVGLAVAEGADQLTNMKAHVTLRPSQLATSG